MNWPFGYSECLAPNTDNQRVPTRNVLCLSTGAYAGESNVCSLSGFQLQASFMFDGYRMRQGLPGFLWKLLRSRSTMNRQWQGDGGLRMGTLGPWVLQTFMGIDKEFNIVPHGVNLWYL